VPFTWETPAMAELHLPWLQLVIAIPLLGAIWVSTLRDPERSRRRSLLVSGATLLCAVGAWLDFATLQAFEEHDRWDLLAGLFHKPLFVVDELSAPLLPLAALIYLLTELATLRTKIRRFSFSLTLASEGILLATLACKLPWGVVALLALGTVPPFIELRRRRKPTRVYALHMGLFVALLAAGQTLMELSASADHPSIAAVVLLSAAVLLRSGVVPVHCWMTDLFEHASFGTSLLFVTPMVGAYGAMRLLLPIAPGWVLESVAILSLITAVYAAGMALVQSDARRFFTYLFLSHSSLVLVGLEIATPIGLTGALCVWLSVGLSLSGFGLTLRSVEARTGRLPLTEFHGLYERMPMLAAFFLLTGLASIGFPGTIGFVGAELLVEGAVRVSPFVGTLVVLAGAVNGLAVVHAYFRIFTGRKHRATVDLRARPPERIAILTLTILILGVGLHPQPEVASRYHAAVQLTAARNALFPADEGKSHDIHGALSSWFAPSTPADQPRSTD
jgi:NADH-quinone oxidoreductase subunit M